MNILNFQGYSNLYTKKNWENNIKKKNKTKNVFNNALNLMLSEEK